MKPNCYKCIHRQSIPGDAHSSCAHPANESSGIGQLMAFMDIFDGGTGIVSPKELNIEANSHGIKKGWFRFPHNFDPVWLENCDGHKEKV